jgi:hypothetical protein
MEFYSGIFINTGKHSIGSPYKSSIAMISSPALKERKTQSVAANPDEKANPRVPFSILHFQVHF